MNPNFTPQQKEAADITSLGLIAQILGGIGKPAPIMVELPPMYDFACPFCSHATLELALCGGGDNHGHLLPCGCRLEAEQLALVIDTLQIPEEAR